MKDEGFLHRVGVYFGLADLNEEERRELEQARALERAKPARQRLRDAALEVALAGVIFGALMVVVTDRTVLDGVVLGLMFGVLMAAVRHWQPD